MRLWKPGCCAIRERSGSTPSVASPCSSGRRRPPSSSSSVPPRRASTTPSFVSFSSDDRSRPHRIDRHGQVDGRRNVRRRRRAGVRCGCGRASAAGPEGRSGGGDRDPFPGTTGAAGVNRTALAEAVLGERSALRRLEALIHPAVAREKQAFLAEHRGAPLVVLDIPLLFEKGGWKAVDKIAVVSAPTDIQKDRKSTRLNSSH